MKAIDKIDQGLAPRLWEMPLDHPAMGVWMRDPDGLLGRIHRALEVAKMHPARTLVLLPFAQLLPMAGRLWARKFGNGFAPRFETTMNWTRAQGEITLGVTDIHFDASFDILTAGSLLVKAGLSTHSELAPRLMQAAHQLGALAAAVAPEQRNVWAQTARVSVLTGMDNAALALETAVYRIAVEWAGLSQYATDTLFDAAVTKDIDFLVVVPGQQAEPFQIAWETAFAGRLQVVPMIAPDTADAYERLARERSMPVQLHACTDLHDEAQRAVSCIAHHIAQGRVPVALVSTDRGLTRRVKYMLDAAGVQIRDENGWKVATTLAGAHIMSLLRAAQWAASTDSVLNWAKSAPTLKDGVPSVEALLRRQRIRDWSHVLQLGLWDKFPEVKCEVDRIEQVRSGLSGSRRLSQWMGVLASALQACGAMESLAADPSGQYALQVLGLVTGEREAVWRSMLDTSLWAHQRLDLQEFSHWVHQSLESAVFKPPYPEREQVVFLPISQMLARPFAALVAAGCDEVRMPSSAVPPGDWTARQRAALGLPSREALDKAAEFVWQQALRTPCSDVLWRTGDEAGEVIQPCTYVQTLQGFAGVSEPGHDWREVRQVPAEAMDSPLPSAPDLVPRTLTQGAYDDLRTCPYRFFAMRQLGLKAADELDAEIDKRDFGVWLHAVLEAFHVALQNTGVKELSQRVALMDVHAEAVTQAMRLPPGEFLPFAAAWPALRDGYLRWLEGHEASGARFVSGESEQAQGLGDYRLAGRVDRVDVLGDGTTLVLDYKTESLAKTRLRVKDPLEDTQMAFYAALMPQDTLQGSYINIGERDGTTAVAQPDVVAARDALLEGILQDMQAISGGAPLPALGAGDACTFCQARGLCRKDFQVPA